MSNRILALLLVLSVPAIAGETPPLFPVRAPQPFSAGASAFEETRRLILDNYYNDEVDEQTLWWAAVRGMLRQVSPPEDPERATLWAPAAYQQVASDLHGVTHSSGLHSSYNPIDGSLTITAVDAGSPAADRLQPWDRVLRINGQPLVGRQAEEIDALLRGEDGATIRLTVVRGIEILERELVFRAYHVPLVDAQALPGDILYLRLRSLSLGASEALLRALGAATGGQPGPRRIVLDLRDNGGGVFFEGLRVAELFLARDNIMVRSVRRREGLQNYVSSNDMPVSARFAVLVNGGTASAAEMLAASLRAHGLASIVGSATFGKATMEETFTLANGYRVKFIVGALYDPQGNSWHANGLTPDVTTIPAPPAALSLPVSERVRADHALAAALRLLQGISVKP